MTIDRRRFLQMAGAGAGLGMTRISSAFHDDALPLVQPSYGDIGGVDILGYTNMQFPGFVGEWDRTYEFRVSADGRFAYTSHQIGFSIVDVSDPKNMHVIARRENDLGQRSQYIDIKGDDILVVKETTRISTWDVSNPFAPSRLGLFEPPDVDGGFHGLWIHEGPQGRFACAVCNVVGYLRDILLIIDINDPSNPFEASRWWYPGQGPGEVPTWPLDGSITVQAHDLTTFEDRAYVGWRDKGLIILDISDITTPVMLGEINWSDGRPDFPSLPGQTHSVGIVVPKHGGPVETVVVTDELGQCPFGFMHFIDVTNVNHPTEISGFRVPLNMHGNCPPDRPGRRMGIHDVERMIRGKIVWSAWEEGGFWGVDFSDVHNPTYAAYYVPPVRSDSPRGSGHADDVFVVDKGIIFGSSSDAGAGGLWAMKRKPGMMGTVTWNADESDVIVEKSKGKKNKGKP